MKTINDNDYKPDLEVCDRYINFSSELLRLSLLAITGLGALIFFSFGKDNDFNLKTADKGCILITLILFALASAGCLAHRFYASDALAYHVASLLKESEEKKLKEEAGRDRCLERADTFLISSEWLFGAAVVALVVTLIVLLRMH